MGFLMIVWIAVVGSAAALLAGWALGTPAGASSSGPWSPEIVAVGLALVVVAIDVAQSLRRRFRR
jgi:hypothetical protein